MKKGMLALLLLILLAACFTAARANTSGNYQYRVLSDGTAAVTGYTGSEKNLKLPSKLNGIRVTRIGDRAFYNNKDIQSVVIPKGVKAIGKEAFFRCSSLNGVTIPEGVKEIGAAAFSECGNLASVTLPDSLTAIGDFAFWDCDTMRRITIPGSVKTISFCAFGCCGKLNSVTIGKGVQKIGEEAFTFCTGLTSVTLPDSVREISLNAFFRCENLKSVNIPDRATLKGNPFSACYRLTKISLSPKNSSYVLSDGVLFDKARRTLICYPSALKRTSYEIPKGTAEIGACAFGGCRNLKKVTVPDSVKVIGERAFKWTSLPQAGTAGKGSEDAAAGRGGTLKEYRYKAQNGTAVDYYIYIPEAADTAKKLPVLIYFHGVSDTMEKHHGIGELLRTGQISPKGIVILPQAVNGTVDADFHQRKYQDAVIELAKAVAKKHHGDMNRLSVSGHSDGGVTAYQIVNAHPGVFAACAPIAGIGTFGKGIRQTYLWAFQGAKDKWVKPNNGLSTVLKCERAGCNAMHYIYKNEGHNIQTMVFQDTFTDENGRKVKLIDWLMSKKLK